MRENEKKLRFVTKKLLIGVVCYKLRMRRWHMLLFCLPDPRSRVRPLGE